MAALRGFLVFMMVLVCGNFAHASEAAWFTILKPDGSAFKNTSVYIYNGDVKFDSRGNEYPYGQKAKERGHYLAEAITDENGNFGIRIQNFSQRSFIFVVGSVYYPVMISKSDDLAHTPSDDHIRFVEWEDNSTRVKANHIYNWREMSVVTYPLDGAPLPAKSAERIILNTYYAPRLAPYLSSLEQGKIDALFTPLKALTYNYNLKEDVHRALVSDHFTLRAYAATYLGKYGTVESATRLIDALSDESVHVGANYRDAGMATTRHRAALALKDLVGEDFGFVWNAPARERKIAVNRWKEWLNERDIILDKVQVYIEAQNLVEFEPYRAHLNAEKDEWGVSLTETPPRLGPPVLTIDRATHEIRLIKGR